jgi:hypothetical protein
MKSAFLICAALIIGAGYVCTTTGAQAAAPNEAGCQVAWSIASPNGATLSQDYAVPYIVDFTMADTNNNGAIDADEFKAACLGGTSKFWSNEVEENAAHICSKGTCRSDGIAYCCP